MQRPNRNGEFFYANPDKGLFIPNSTVLPAAALEISPNLGALVNDIVASDLNTLSFFVNAIDLINNANERLFAIGVLIKGDKPISNLPYHYSISGGIYYKFETTNATFNMFPVMGRIPASGLVTTNPSGQYDHTQIVDWTILPFDQGFQAGIGYSSINHHIIRGDVETGYANENERDIFIGWAGQYVNGHSAPQNITVYGGISAFRWRKDLQTSDPKQ